MSAQLLPDELTYAQLSQIEMLQARIAFHEMCAAECEAKKLRIEATVDHGWLPQASGYDAVAADCEAAMVRHVEQARVYRVKAGP